jgi:hypothetical protein
MERSETSEPSVATARTSIPGSQESRKGVSQGSEVSVGHPNDIFANFAKTGGAGLGEDDDIFSMFAGWGGMEGRRAEATPKGNAIPNRASDLKHAATHYSGYGSCHVPSGTSPSRYMAKRYDNGIDILVDTNDPHRRTRNSSPPPRQRDRRGRRLQPSTYRHDSARSTQPRSGSPRDSPSVSRHNRTPFADPYTTRYPQTTSRRFNKQDVKYGSSGGQTPDLSSTSPPRYA